MSSAGLKPKPPWEDRFNRPTWGALVEGCPKHFAPVLEHARASLLAIDGMREQLGWQGLPWRWALSFHHECDPDRAFAFLVPNPGAPRLALPLPPRVVAELKVKRLTKAIRDGVLHAPIVGEVRWAQWEIGTKTATDDVLALAEIKVGGAAVGAKA